MSRYAAATAGPTAAAGPFRPGSRVEEGTLELPDFRLQRGGRVDPARIAWRLAGTAGGPVVAALGGISADRTVHDTEFPRRGWWSEIVGPGLLLDTLRYRVLAIDWLHSSNGVAPIDVRDQARTLLAVCDELGIERLHAFVGASYGAMVGLALAEIAPLRLRHLLAISAAHRSDALSTAWRAIQREIVRHALELGDGAGGLRIARALAMATYRTRTELNARFPVKPGRRDRTEYAVEDYLFARGADFARRHSPESFLQLSESIDAHAVDPSRITVPVTLVAIREDQLVPLEDMRELAAGLAGPRRLFEVSSHYGHDAFLKERELLAPAFAAALEGDAT